MSVRSESNSQLAKKLTITSCDSTFADAPRFRTQSALAGATSARSPITDQLLPIRRPTFFEKLFSPNGADCSPQVRCVCRPFESEMTPNHRTGRILCRMGLGFQSYRHLLQR
jgi:hypothetical protein